MQRLCKFPSKKLVRSNSVSAMTKPSGCPGILYMGARSARKMANFCSWKEVRKGRCKKKVSLGQTEDLHWGKMSPLICAEALVDVPPRKSHCCMIKSWDNRVFFFLQLTWLFVWPYSAASISLARGDHKIQYTPPPFWRLPPPQPQEMVRRAVKKKTEKGKEGLPELHAHPHTSPSPRGIWSTMASIGWASTTESL